jgi:hypothetical protein
MRAIFLTAVCVIVCGLLVALMAEGPRLGVFKPSLGTDMGPVET